MTASECTHDPVKNLDAESYNVGDEIDCDDCGKSFVVQFNGYQNRRIFVAEDVAEVRTDDEETEARYQNPPDYYGVEGAPGMEEER